jgi:hypothetical protein
MEEEGRKDGEGWGAGGRDGGRWVFERNILTKNI